MPCHNSRALRFLTGAAVLLIALSSVMPRAATATDQPTAAKTFDISSDTDFRNYETVIRRFIRRHHPEKAHDFCVVGYVAGDGSKLAWVLWRQGRQIILWEGGDAGLEMSRRKLDLRTDVVKSESEINGSTYLVTKAWVDDLSASCDRSGTKLHLGKRQNRVVG